MTACDQSRLSVAVLLCLLCLKRVTAQNVSVQSSPKPSCTKEPVVFNCSVDFPSFFIRWDHTAFTTISLTGSTTFVGNSSSTSGGRVVAELTMREDRGDSLYLLGSTITIYPPLNDLNNINLDNTNIMCDGTDGPKKGSTVASIVLEGNVSSPVNLTSPATNSLANAIIEWDPPLYSGNGIVNYTISIPSISYVRSETGTYHTIQTKSGHRVEYYDVHVTAISVCGSVSGPANYSLRIQPSAPPQPSLSVSLMCSVGKSVRADLQWQYGLPSSTMYTPPTDSVTVEINPDPPSPTECDVITPSDMSCSFNTTTNTMYTVVVYATNIIGNRSSNAVTFDSRALLVDESGLTSSAPYINVSVNRLCQDYRTYILSVPFGDTSSDTSSSKEGSELSVSGAVGLTFSLTFITAFILGATFVLALYYFLPSRKRRHVDLPAAQEVAEAAAIYDLPSDPVRDNKSEPLTSDNTAYGVPQGPSTTTNPAYERVQR